MSGDSVDEAAIVKKFGAAMTPYVTPEPLGEYADNGDVRKRTYYEVRVNYQLSEDVSGVVVHHFDERIKCLEAALAAFGTGQTITFGTDPEVNTFLRMVTSAMLNAPDFYTTFYHRPVYRRINPDTIYGDSFLGSHWLNCLACPIPELVSFSLVTTARGLVTPYAVSRVRDKAIVAKHLFSQILIVSSSPSTRRAAGKVQMVKAADGSAEPVPQLMYMDVGALMYTRPATMPFCFTFDGMSGLLVGLNAIYAGFASQPRTKAEIEEARLEMESRREAVRRKQKLALNPLYMDKDTQRAIRDGEIDLSTELERRKRQTVALSLIQYGPDHRPMLDSSGSIAKAPVKVAIVDVMTTFQLNPQIAPYVFGDSNDNMSGATVNMPKPTRPIPDDENADVYDELFAAYTRKMAKYNALVAGIPLEKLTKLADAGEWEKLGSIYKRALAAYHIDHAPKTSTKQASLGTSLGGKRIKQFKSSRNIADIFGSFTEDEPVEPPPAPLAKKRPPTAPNAGSGPGRKSTRQTGKKSKQG